MIFLQGQHPWKLRGSRCKKYMEIIHSNLLSNVGNENGNFLWSIEIEYDRRYIFGDLQKTNSSFDVMQMQHTVPPLSQTPVLISQMALRQSAPTRPCLHDYAWLDEVCICLSNQTSLLKFNSTLPNTARTSSLPYPTDPLISTWPCQKVSPVSRKMIIHVIPYQNVKK